MTQKHYTILRKETRRSARLNHNIQGMEEQIQGVMCSVIMKLGEQLGHQKFQMLENFISDLLCIVSRKILK